MNENHKLTFKGQQDINIARVCLFFSFSLYLYHACWKLHITASLTAQSKVRIWSMTHGSSHRHRKLRGIRTLSWFFTSITNGYMSVQQYDWLLGDRWGWRPLLELQTSHIQDLLSLVSLFYEVSSFNNVTGEAKPWLIMFNCMFPIQVCSVFGIISMLINEAEQSDSF